MDNFLVPLYIGKTSTTGSGKNKIRESFYFYGTKDGVGRFIKYSNYPFWDMGSKLPDFLVLEEAPEHVMKDVRAFVEGRVEFELIPKTKGRHEKVLRKEVSYKQEYGVNDASITGNTTGGDSTVSDDCRSKSSHADTYEALSSGKETFQDKVQEYRLPPPTKDRESVGSKGCGFVGTSSGYGSNLVRGIRTGPGLGGKLSRPNGIVPDANSASSIAGTRRESESGILDDTRDGPRTGDGEVAVYGSECRPFDGHAPVKQKRVRRTKAELASGRSLEEIRASREG